jgi:hypothetical protein
MLLCITCSEIFNKEYLKPTKNGSYVCPKGKSSCAGDLIEVDDLLVEFIKIFFNLELETWSSCSGHLYEQFFNPNILFSNRIEENYIVPYSVIIEDLYEICNDIIKDKPFKDIIKIEEIRIINMMPPYKTSYKTFDHKVFSIFTHTEKDNILRDRIKIQNIFLRYLDKIIDVVYNLTKGEE